MSQFWLLFIIFTLFFENKLYLDSSKVFLYFYFYFLVFLLLFSIFLFLVLGVSDYSI